MRPPPPNPTAPPASFQGAGLRYRAMGPYLAEQFGGRVQKVSVDAGFGCPNVDGTLSVRGCRFCNVASFSPSRRSAAGSIAEQIDEGVGRLRRRYGAERFLAYFQPGTNTHAPPERLREAFGEAIAHPDVVGMVVGTRPDCAGEAVLDLLAELAGKTWLLVEFGLQTIHDRSLDWLGRGHRYDAFLDAAGRSRRRGLRIGAHLIVGLPGETRSDVQATARELARLRVHSVKLHNLYVARNTPLADLWSAGELALPDCGEYAALAVDCIELLHPECVIDRLSADAPPEFLLAPAWCGDKRAVRAAIHAELQRRDTWQGRLFPASAHSQVAAEKQLGDCPSFRAAKMGLSPSESDKLSFGRSRATGDPPPANQPVANG